MSRDVEVTAEEVRGVTAGFSRRRLLGWTGAGVAVAGVGAVSGYAAGTSTGRPGPEPGSDVVPFRDTYQAGITTPAQNHLYFAALDLTSTSRPAVQRLLATWTPAAERMTTGKETVDGGALPLNPEAPPADTGEALDLPAASLTVTIGFGPSFFDKLGIADRRPAALADLPPFARDRIDPARSGGDLCIQACANDPQVAVHAVRNLIRMGFGTTSVRWAQQGYGRTSSTSEAQPTARNLFGFKDGTNNLKSEEQALLDEHVWTQQGDGPDWMTGGTYLVARRIRMQIETWDRASLKEQEAIIGRTKGAGAPLGGTHEFDPANLKAIDANGSPVIPRDSHIRLAAADSLNGIRMLRRGFNFVDGADGQGHLDAGLFFICFVRNPQTQFVPMQRALSRNDRMLEYVEHTSSAVFACPPGLSQGDYWGRQLLEGQV
jgi:deferrochelatase/peroxidase EfeB